MVLSAAVVRRLGFAQAGIDGGEVKRLGLLNKCFETGEFRGEVLNGVRKGICGGVLAICAIAAEARLGGC